jgi:hypothetical protein
MGTTMATMIKVVRLPLNDLKYFRIQKPVPLVEIYKPTSQRRHRKRQALLGSSLPLRLAAWAYNRSPDISKRLSGREDTARQQAGYL